MKKWEMGKTKHSWISNVLHKRDINKKMYATECEIVMFDLQMVESHDWSVCVLVRTLRDVNLLCSSSDVASTRGVMYLAASVGKAAGGNAARIDSL